jgi:hypothetical protein
MRNSFITFLLLSAVCSGIHAQGIRGVIQDTNGNPVPYAAIYIKELTRGTTCNALGNFSLPLPEGEYTIFFRSLGYTEVSKKVVISTGYADLVVKLPPQTYMIPEVRISATGEDPAYWIMRKTIGLANYHLEEVSSYEAEIYIKGTAIVENMPRAIARRIEVNDLKVKEDEVYMLESMNEVQFNAPDHYKMRVIASQNTLPGYTDNVNPMDYINASLYQEQIEGVVSPLARSAFSYYRYSFEGTFLEGTHIVNRIRVTPKRKSQQLVEGTLYIVEDLWCLHSSDLTLSTIAGDLHLQQLYANVIMDAWLPVNHKIQANIDIAGVKGQATYVSSLKYSDVTLNPNLPETYFEALQPSGKIATDTAELKEPVSRDQEVINELLQKEELSNREVAKLSKLIEKETERNQGEMVETDLNQTGTTFSIAEDAVKNDSLYWNDIRPIPLTPEEHVTLQVRDSITGSRITAASGDSAQVARRRGKPFRNLVYGKTYIMNRGRLRFTYEGLLDIERFGYNTVDGIYYGQAFGLDWRPDSLKTVRSALTAGYAFHRSAPLVAWDSDLLYAPLRRGKLALNLRYTSSDFNLQTGIPDPTNLVYTVFLRQNYLKMFEQIDATLFNRIDLVNGLVLQAGASIGLQNQLENHSYFSIFYRNAPEERFTPNTPEGRPRDAPELIDHRRFLAEVSLEYTPQHYYEIRNNRKTMKESRWPTFTLGYRMAIPLAETGWSEFSMVEAGISHSFEVGLLSTLEWSLKAGAFPDTASIHFSDFRHFKTNALYVDMARLNQALMFPGYYQPSTHRYWLSFNATLTSSYLMIKFLPWFSERLWKESVDIAYLYTPGLRNYVQVGYRLEEIFFLVDLGLYVGFVERGPGGEGDWGYEGVTARLNFRF